MNNQNVEKTELKKPEEVLLGDDASIRSYFASIAHEADIVEFLRQSDRDLWPKLLRLIDDKERRALVVSMLDREESQALLAMLEPDEIAQLANYMESDDAADMMGELSLPERNEALQQLSLKERLQLQQLMTYPEDSAGGIMQLERAQVSNQATVADAIAMVRKLVEDDVEVFTVWVVDEKEHLIGSLALVDLLLNKATTKVSDIMNPNVVSVTPLLDQEKVAEIFKKYDLIALPVVDDQGKLLGRIAIDDVVDVLSEEADEDALHMAGTSAEELMHREEVFGTARIRLPWLGVALGCSFVSAFLLRFFQPMVQEAVIILSFLPVITAMGGNVGTQSATLLIRGFATGKLQLHDVPKFLFKEVRVGFLVGSVYGLSAGLFATFIITPGNFYFGLVVCVAMICGMMTAATMGVLAPALLKKMGIDPAIAAGPFVTTFNDITGIIIYMTISALFINHLLNT